MSVSSGSTSPGSQIEETRGSVHFVLPDAIGSVKIVNNIAPEKVLAAIEAALA